MNHKIEVGRHIVRGDVQHLSGALSKPTDRDIVNIAFQRTGEPSTIFPGAVPGMSEAVTVRVVEEANPGHGDDLENGSQTAIRFVEEFSADDVVDAVSRSRDWSESPVFRFAMHRFRISAEDAEKFEDAVRMEMDIVRQQEPGTLLYTFFRRAGRSSLLPMPNGAHQEYLHLMAFESEAAQLHHRELEFRENGWAWGRVFPDLLRVPLENEAFFHDTLLFGVTRDSKLK